MAERREDELERSDEHRDAGRSDDAAALVGLADAHHARGQLSEAIDGYRRAIALGADDPAAWWGLGCALAALGDHAPAVESFRRLAALQPGNGMALINLGQSLFELGQVDPALDAFRRSLGRLPEEADCMALANIAIVIPGSPTAGNREILEARRAWATRCLPAAPPHRAPARRDPAGGGRLRLGYVSALFDQRNWMKPVWALINHHDRDRFEVHLFSDRPGSSTEAVYRREAHESLHHTHGMSNRDLARLVEELGIDILIDLNGYSRPARLGLFALRPAPVQAAWFNMYGTSGLGHFDYLVGDRHVIPPEEEAFYTERIVRVPGSYLTFDVSYPVPEVAPAPCLRGGSLTFGCLAPLYKITAGVVEAWSRILGACPGTRLLLKGTALGRPEARDFVRGLFAGFGVAADRLLLEGPADHFEFLARYADVDLALDTFPYNGGTTTMEALWQGVPVVTFAGDRWASRTGASLLREAGLPEFVADDREDYVSRAIAMARDPETPGRLDRLRRGMRHRLRAAPVCDAARFAREMEQEYRKMVDLGSLEGVPVPAGEAPETPERPPAWETP